jgi:nucleolin
VTAFITSHSLTVESLRLPTWQDTGRLRGFGHVVFPDSSTAAKAVEVLDRVQYPQSTRYIRISMSKPPKSVQARDPGEQPEGCRTVFVRNLPYDYKTESLRDLMSQFGKVEDNGVRIPLMLDGSGRNKGFGYVTFKNAEGAAGAVGKAKKAYGLCEEGGRPLVVGWEEGGRVKGSFKTEEGRNWAKVEGGKGKKRKEGPKL